MLIQYLPVLVTMYPLSVMYKCTYIFNSLNTF